MINRVADAAPAPAWEGPLTIGACDAAPLTLPGEAETALNATLLVRGERGVGSAVLISPHGFAMTAAHVVGQSRRVAGIAHSGATFDAVVVRVDEPRDVALIKLPSSGATPCLSPAPARPGIGSDVFVFGSPGGEELSFSLSKGIVAAHRNLGGHRFLQLDASVNPGNSGGPAVDASGGVLGIVSWKISDVSVEGLAFAVPIDVALAALEVELGPQTDASWAAQGGRRTAPVSTPSDGQPATGAQADAAEERRRRIVLRDGLIISGGTGVTIGVTALPLGLSLYLIEKDDPESSSSGTGWLATAITGAVLTAAGVALLAAGFALRQRARKRARSTKSTARTGWHLRASGAGLQARF